LISGQLSPARYSTEPSNEKGSWLCIKRVKQLPPGGSIASIIWQDREGFGGEDGWAGIPIGAGMAREDARQGGRGMVAHPSL